MGYLDKPACIKLKFPPFSVPRGHPGAQFKGKTRAHNGLRMQSILTSNRRNSFSRGRLHFCQLANVESKHTLWSFSAIKYIILLYVRVCVCATVVVTPLAKPWRPVNDLKISRWKDQPGVWTIREDIQALRGLNNSFVRAPVSQWPKRVT